MSNNQNGVNVDGLKQFVEAVSQNNAMGDVKFRAKSKWVGGTRAAVTIDEFYSAGQKASPSDRKFTMLVDEPGALGGTDLAPNPMEYLAAALCGCLTAGIATNAAMFGTELSAIDITVDAEMNVMGLFGLSDTVPANNRISYTVKLSGPGSKEAIAFSKEVIDRKSPVRSMLETVTPMKTTMEVVG